MEELNKFVKAKYMLFFSAMLQVSFVAMQPLFIVNHKIIPMLLTGFLISMIWTFNIKKVAFGGWPDRLVYAIGAMCGTGFGYWISNITIKYL